MISVTESGNYWTFLFKPQARSKLRRSYSHMLHFLPLHSPTDTLSEFGQSKQHCALWRSPPPKSPRAPPGLVLHQQKLEVSPESGVQCPVHRAFQVQSIKNMYVRSILLSVPLSKSPVWTRALAYKWGRSSGATQWLPTAPQRTHDTLYYLCYNKPDFI